MEFWVGRDFGRWVWDVFVPLVGVRCFGLGLLVVDVEIAMVYILHKGRMEVVWC